MSTRFARLGSSPRARAVGALLALGLPLAACNGDAAEGADNKTASGSTEAQGAKGGEAGGPAPTAAAQFSAADTASRNVAKALAAGGDTAGELAAGAADIQEIGSAGRTGSDSTRADSMMADTARRPSTKYRAGEDPAFAARNGWPVRGPKALPGALLPSKRIICYYGNPNSKKMGALGEFPREDMLRRLQRQAAEWQRADPATPVVPCLHMVTVVAQGDPGRSGKYRSQLRDSQVDSIHKMAQSIKGIFFIDVQVGQDDIRNFVKPFEEFLKKPDIHFAVDPEFYMRGGVKPGAKIGTMYASDINYVTGELARIVRENNLPPKVLVIHRFTRNMVQGTKDIILRPEVQIVIDMDGWGAPWLKRDSYRDYVVNEPVQYTGFKLFYGNDTKKGDPIMSPTEVLKLRPRPLYIQYQ